MSDQPPVVSLQEQNRIEATLAQRLADAPPAERAKLYGAVYDRVYEMHLGRDPNTLDFGAGAPFLVSFLERLTRPGEELVEVGCGGGLLAIEMVRRGRRVLGVEVSARILDQARRRAGDLAGLTLTRTDGVDIPAATSGADFAYSIQVFEHLHPEDVLPHLREVHRVLRPGGCYWLLTPNRLDRIGSPGQSGEDDHAIHLKEWTYSELIPALREAGFETLRSPWRNASLAWLPLMPASWFAGAERLPSRVLGQGRARSLLGIVACSIVAAKPGPD